MNETAGGSPARIVVRAPNWLGDIVMSLPALAAVRRRFPAAALAVAAPAGVAPFLGAVPGVDEILPIVERRAFAGVRAEARLLRSGRFDLAVLFTNSFSTALAAWLARIPARWGYRADARRWLLTRAIRKRQPGASSVHHSDYYRRLVAALDMPAPERTPPLVVPARWLVRGAALLEAAGIDRAAPVVGIAPGAAYGGAKRWPVDNVARLMALVVDRTRWSVALVGTSADRETGHAIESAVASACGDRARGRIANVIGRTDLPALVGVAARSAAFVSNDSGAMHVAAALGVPTVAVFGPTDERATAPSGPHALVTADVFCRPCHLRECPIDHRCMTRIGADRVLDRLLELTSIPT